MGPVRGDVRDVFPDNDGRDNMTNHVAGNQNLTNHVAEGYKSVSSSTGVKLMDRSATTSSIVSIYSHVHCCCCVQKPEISKALYPLLLRQLFFSMLPLVGCELTPKCSYIPVHVSGLPKTDINVNF